jgi:hypothetical protein
MYDGFQLRARLIDEIHRADCFIQTLQAPRECSKRREPHPASLLHIEYTSILPTV